MCRTIASEGWAVLPPYRRHATSARGDRCPPSNTTMAQRRCVRQTAYRLCPLPAVITLSSSDISSAYPPRHRRVSLRTLAIRQSHYIMLMSPNQSVPNPPKTKFLSNWREKVIFFHFYLFVLCDVFMQFFTKIVV